MPYNIHKRKKPTQDNRASYERAHDSRLGYHKHIEQQHHTCTPSLPTSCFYLTSHQSFETVSLQGVFEDVLGKRQQIV